MTFPVAIASLGLASWLFLLLGRGWFWRTGIRDDNAFFAEPAAWPSIAAVIPARDEADILGHTLPTLLRNDYKGAFTVTLVDDRSEDGTVSVAREAARRVSAEDRLTLIEGAPLPHGWAGKLWAVSQGIDHVLNSPERPKYVLLTDADIAYTPGVIKRLVARAEAQGLVLTSLMVKLNCESLAERFLIPAFVFFFQMLYPFSWVNRPNRKTAAAAGGLMLIRLDALQKAGGIAAIRGALIDDCAMGSVMKAQGPIWLGLTQHVLSMRPYPHFEDIRRMVARSAYDQLRYSPLLLLGTILGMTLAFVAPVALSFFAPAPANLIGVAAWALMSLCFLPMVRFYGLSPLGCATLPLVAAFYMFFTLDSAYQYARGRGGLWKGRVQAGKVGA